MKKVALIQDWLTTVAGSEACLKEIIDLYPNADIYTIIANQKTLDELNIDPKKVTQSFIAKLPFAQKHFRKYLPLFPLAVEQFDLSEYDLIISSSHAVAKGVLTSANQTHITYVHSPMRYAWDMYHEYLKQSHITSGIKSIYARFSLHYLRNWDRGTANRPDHYIANSNYIAKRIAKTYDKRAAVIYPPVNLDKFQYDPEIDKEDFYFTFSRMVPYKRIQLIVEAFNKMPNKKLIVAGTGPEFETIKRIVKNNVKLLGFVTDEVLISHLQRAKAFVFAANEDFGIAPVEAMACGTPVIAYGTGGVTETVQEAENTAESTGLFFKEQSIPSISQAIARFENVQNDFDNAYIHEHAKQFDKGNFKEKIKTFIHSKFSF